jgi:hypothetical protein
MNIGQTVFSQIMAMIPKYQFDKCVDKFKGDYKSQKFNCWSQFLCMSFAQLTYRESLSDIATCLNAIGNKRYHLGLKYRIAKSTLAYANETTDWHIYSDFAQVLISKALDLYKNDSDLALDLMNAVYALDSTTIDLCLSMFPWARFRKTKSAIKLHTILDVKCSIPTCIIITEAKLHDVNIIDSINLEPGAFYLVDRGYTDFERLYSIHKHLCYFVIRAKKNLSFDRIYSRKTYKSQGIVCDQTVKLKGHYAKRNYPERLRRIKIFDSEKSSHIVLLTNNFDLQTSAIAELYRNRWKVELFFKWIKQHLKIKSFFGTSVNAVKSQIWISISIYTMIAIIKKELKIELSLYTILQILSISLFEKVPMNTMFSKNDYNLSNIHNSNLLTLFD